MNSPVFHPRYPIEMKKQNNGAAGQPKSRKPKTKLGPTPRQKKRAGDQGFGTFLASSAPLAESNIVYASGPKFIRVSDREQRIIHREKVATITGGGNAFSVLKTVPLNPGMASSFPWLCNEARGWERYRWNRLAFLIVPTVAASSAGNWLMATDFDASDAAPASETAMSAYSDSVEGNLWVKILHELDPDRLNGDLKSRYVRNAALSANQDIKMYDAGNEFIASAGDGGGDAKVWVQYDVSLMIPQVPVGGFFSTGTYLGATSLAAATPFGTAGSAFGSPALSAAALVLTAQDCVIGQEYALFIELTGTVMSVLTLTLTTGATAVTGAKNSLVNAGATEIAAFVTFNPTATTVTVTLAVTATTVTASKTVLTNLAPAPGF